jgi:site-specific DNA-methyltransferase (adenine-specific)
MKLKDNNIYNMDCIKGIKLLKDNSVDIIIADPPYNIGKDFGNNSDKQEFNKYIDWCKEWIDECFRVLKDGGTFYIYGFSEILAYLRVLIKYDVRWLIWHYTNKNSPTNKFWQRSHESILCCYKTKPIFNLDDVREPYSDNYLKSVGKERKSTKGRFSDGSKTTTYKAHKKGALPRDVLKFPALAGGAGKKERVDHPTQKPLSLTEHLLKASKNKKIKNNLLLVPFVGSGTECVAAKDLGINYIGFEKNKDYVKLAKKRIKDMM